MSCLYLTEADVDRLIDMPTAIDAMQRAFVSLAEGRAINVPRKRAKAGGVVLHSMSAAAEYLGLVGWKQYTTTRDGARFLVGLYDHETGALRALISADRLGQIRTGAVTGLAARWLAAESAGQVGVFGSGWQAESQLTAVAAARPIKQAVVYSRDPDRRRAFANRMTKTLGIDVRPADAPREAVEGMPIVVTATTSRVPVFDGAWLDDSALVCAIGSNWLNKAEIDITTVQRAARVVCDSIACCREEAGDFQASLQADVFAWSDAVELPQIVTRRMPSVEGIQIFKSVGMALEDIALGHVLLDRAEQNGLGSVLPID